MEDSREGKRDEKKELCTPGPHVGDRKDKRVIVYKTRTKKRKEEEGMLEETHG